MRNSDKTVDHYFSSNPKTDDKFGLIKAKLCGRNFEFLTSSSVFSKKKIDSGSNLLIESMVLPKEGKILDIGCGYGAVGIAAAKFNPKLQVTMSDINARAVNLAKKNVALNKVAAQVLYGYLYEPVEGTKFDCILSNPPVSAGMDTVKAIITEAPNVLAPNGSLQMVVLSKIGAKLLPDLFKETFGHFEVLSRESGYRVLMGILS
jgi:16S rRNA (guanine1207-N2)-methyltransferase